MSDYWGGSVYDDVEREAAQDRAADLVDYDRHTDADPQDVAEHRRTYRDRLHHTRNHGHSGAPTDPYATLPIDPPF